MLTTGKNLGLLDNGDYAEQSYFEMLRLMRGLDVLVQPHVISRTTDLPEAFAEGDAYIVPVGATDVWTGKDNFIARWTARSAAITPQWEFFTPKLNWVFGVDDDTSVPFVRWDGSAWVVFNSGGGSGTPGTVWRVGAGTPSDTLGVNGDFYLNSTNGDVYLKSNGSYSLDSNIRGPAGSSGDGTGDMLKSVYDPNDDGKVTSAAQADSVPWSGITNPPTTMPPSAHNHTTSEVTELDTALASKAPTVSPSTSGTLTHAGKIVLNDSSSSSINDYAFDIKQSDTTSNAGRSVFSQNSTYGFAVSVNSSGTPSAFVDLQWLTRATGLTNSTPLRLRYNGSIELPTLGARITGDFSDSTVTNRVMFQTSTADGNTVVSALPNGAATGSSFDAFNSSDPANSNRFRFQSLSTENRISDVFTGTGSYLPLTLYTGGAERVRVTANGDARPWYVNTQTQSGGTLTYNPATYGQVALVTLSGSAAITFGAPTNIVEGAMYKFILKAGDTSARTFAWNAAYKFPGGASPLTSGTATLNAYDTITFIGGSSNTLIYDGHSADVR